MANIEVLKLPSTKIKKLNLPLSEETHRALFEEARRAGVPATRIVRTALEEWLRQRQRERRRDEIHEFATRHAGSEYDLDPILESNAADETVAYDEELDATR